jgi:N-6 DNA Methylase
MARKPIADLSAWPSLTLEGNLIAPAMVAHIAEPKDDADTRESYGIRKGLTIREEISTAFRVGQSHFDAFAKLENPSVEATRRFVRNFLKETFGFDDLAPAEGAVSFLASGRVPIVVVPPTDEKLDRRSPALSTDRARSPAFALQDYLNESDHALWGLVTNGAVIRLMRDNASLTRPAYIEADLAQIFANEDAASFAVLWLLIHRTQFGAPGAPPTDCDLERSRDGGSRQGEAARDRLAAQVETALKVLGSGFLEANPDLAARLKSGNLNLTEWFNELLRLVYRLIFLMVAEDRNLLHPEKAKADARRLYVEGYSLAALRAQCFRRAAWDKHQDRFEGVKIVFRALAHGQASLALPALGGIFAEDRLPHLETARLRNRAFMEALFRLSWLSDTTGMVPVNWRAMETEELGSVYESLLELQPQLGDDGKTLVFASETAEQKGNQRKTTGSYYTPDSLVQALLDTALDPVLDLTEAEAADPANALLKLSVIDPACGSGHFLLAAARRVATRLARIRAEGTPSLADFRHALRDVARCCLYGVDRNPMAVELTKVALWIETVDPGLPLGFLDAQIRCGDSLLGVFDLKELEQGIPDAAYKPLTGDDKEVAKHFAKRNKSEREGQGSLDFSSGVGALPAARQFADLGGRLRTLRENTLEDVVAKARQFQELRASPDWYAWKVTCDAYVAAFLAPKTGCVPTNRNTVTIPTTDHVWSAMAGRMPYGPLAGRVADLAGAARAFHWPLEFPDIMAAGGFDAVLGNPPWDIVELDKGEYFAQRLPEVTNLEGTAREDAIAALEYTARQVFIDYQNAKRQLEAANEFSRASGRFRLTAKGRLNTYALFAELFTQALASRGRAGVIVPTGIATDANTAPFFSSLITNRQLVSLYDFQTGMGFFDRIGHARFKFSLMTISQTGQGEIAPEFSFFSRTMDDFSDRRRFFRLTAEDISLINPNTRTAPVFRTELDAKLSAKIYARVPILLSERVTEHASDWDFEFRQGLFNKTADGKLFRSYSELDNRGKPNKWLPVYEGNHGFVFDHRLASYDGKDFSLVSEEQKKNSEFEVQAEIFIKKKDFQDRLSRKGFQEVGYWVAIRRVARSTDERTVVAAVIPGLPATYGWLIAKQPLKQDSAVICANLNSLVFDYCMRLKLSQPSITLETLYQMPFICRSQYTPTNLAFIVTRVLELTYTSHAMEPFARDLSHNGPPFAWDEDRRAALRAELDAWYARAYGITRDELRYILDPAEAKGADYPSETFRVLKEKEIRQFSEYRTRRLVLEAWDQMEADGTFKAMGM